MKTGFTSGNSGNFYRNLPSMFLRDLFSYYPGYLHKEKKIFQHLILHFTVRFLEKVLNLYNFGQNAQQIECKVIKRSLKKKPLN